MESVPSSALLLRQEAPDAPIVNMARFSDSCSHGATCSAGASILGLSIDRIRLWGSGNAHPRVPRHNRVWKASYLATEAHLPPNPSSWIGREFDGREPVVASGSVKSCTLR